MAGKTILEVQNLTKFFNTPGGQLHAVDGVSFKIEEGRFLPGCAPREFDPGADHSSERIVR